MIDLSNSSFCVLGLRKSGKSTLADVILSQSGNNALYYDTLGESPASSTYDYYVPKDRYSADELQNVISQITPKSKEDVQTFSPTYRLFIIDEANRFCPPKPKPLPDKVADLNDQCRHYHIGVGYIARRPCQLHSDLIELSDYIFVFRLTGKNDLQYLDSTVSGLAEAVRNLGLWEFVLVHPDKHFEICLPLRPNKAWIDRSKHERERM